MTTHFKGAGRALLGTSAITFVKSEVVFTAEQIYLYIPRVKTKAGTRAFSVAAPKVWNSLPASVKSQGNIVSFRRHLKTYLFNAAYPP